MNALWAIALTVSVAGAPVSGPSRRFAIVVGNDSGSGARPALRYAERDAARVSRALIEVGDVAAPDVQLLKGRKASEVEAAFGRLKARVFEFHRTPGARALVVFYFSGHGDGATIELGPDKLSYGKLKALLSATGADIRLGVVDACNSSAIIEAGGKAAPGFTLQADDRLLASGEAFITSSAADEYAIESAAFSGSVFSHHLVAGLRGAADRSGDQLVSLDELYRYAYERTAATAGGQHPGYAFRLSGQGELILSNIKRARSAVELPPRAEQVTLSDAERGEVLAQLDGAAARVLAIPPGRYQVKASRDGQVYAGRFNLEDGVRGALGWEGLRLESAPGKWLTAGLLPISGDAAPEAPPLGLTVLPFQGNRGDPALEAVSAALTQAVSFELGRVEGARLFRAKGARIEAKDLAELGHSELLNLTARDRLQQVPGAELAILGLVSRSGELVNASIYLLDVPTGRVLDAAHGARPKGAAGGLGEELAHEVAAAVRSALDRRRPR